MEATFSNLLETLPLFLEKDLRDPDLALQDIPPVLHKVISHRANLGGVRYDFQLRPCAEIVGRVLDDICHEQLEAIIQKPGAFQEPVRLMFSILLVRTQYLAFPVYKKDIRFGSQAIDLLRQPNYTKKVFPKSLPPPLRSALELDIQGMMDEERTQSGSVAPSRQNGLRVLAEAIWDEYESLISTAPFISEPESPEIPQDREQPEESHRPPHQAQILLPPLPAYYVPTEIAEEVTKALVASKAGDSPCYQVIVLHGAPGAGKTTTAEAVLHHQPLREFFRDGILFIPLKSKEDRQQALWRACRQAGLAIERAAMQDDLKYAYWQWARWESRQALLVLDEPQQAEDLLPLLNVGPQVRVLITCHDRQAVTRALEERWGPASDLVLWQAVSGLTPQEGLRLVQHWQADALPPDQDRAMRHVGEMLHWQPLALRVSVPHAQATSWQSCEAEVIGGHLDPNNFQELAANVESMWARLSPQDQQALSDLRRAFHETSSFGSDIAADVWNQDDEQAEKCMKRLEERGVIEEITQEPWPLQRLIEAAYNRQQRYRLFPLIRIVKSPPDEPRWYDRFGWKGFLWRLKIALRARGLMANLPLTQQPGSRLRELALTLLLIRHESKWNRPDLEERLQDLWEVKGLFPPAEVWIDFKKVQWFYGSPRMFLALLGTPALVGAIMWTLAAKASTLPFLAFAIAALLIFVCTLPLWILGTQQRAYWTLLLGLYEPEMPEALFVRQCRERWGLPDPFDDA